MSLKRSALNTALESLREYGVQHVELRGRALPPWMRKWADDNGAAFVDDPDAPLGHAYLTHKELGRTFVL